MPLKEKHLISYRFALAVLIMAAISIVAIWGATPLINYANPGGYYIKQAFFYAIGLAIIVAIFNYTNDRIYSAKWIVYWFLIALLVGLAIEHIAITKLGISIIPRAIHLNGATSWYSIPGFSLQPSEFMKVFLVVTLADLIYQHNLEGKTKTLEDDLYLIYKILKVTILPILLILLQNDTGVTLIIIAATVAIAFSAGLNHRWFSVIFIGLAIAIVVVAYLFVFHHQVIVDIFGGDYKLGRIYGWLDPEGTYENQGYQLLNALMSYGTSGMFGHGFQSVIINFPEAQTDFIFAVICQDFGFIGGLVTLMAILFFDFSIIYVGIRCEDPRNKYLISGFMGMLIFQQFWNIGMILGLLPITGITLPLLSYGGSSLLSYMIVVGMVFEAEKQTRIKEGKNRYVIN